MEKAFGTAASGGAAAGGTVDTCLEPGSENVNDDAGTDAGSGAACGTPANGNVAGAVDAYGSADAASGATAAAACNTAVAGTAFIGTEVTPASPGDVAAAPAAGCKTATASADGVSSASQTSCSFWRVPLLAAATLIDAYLWWHWVTSLEALCASLPNDEQPDGLRGGMEQRWQVA